MSSLEEFREFCSELVLDNGRPMILEPFQLAMLEDHFLGVPEVLNLLPKSAPRRPRWRR